jgi:hypothetical protein
MAPMGHNVILRFSTGWQHFSHMTVHAALLFVTVWRKSPIFSLKIGKFRVNLAGRQRKNCRMQELFTWFPEAVKIIDFYRFRGLFTPCKHVNITSEIQTLVAYRFEF